MPRNQDVAAGPSCEVAEHRSLEVNALHQGSDGTTRAGCHRPIGWDARVTTLGKPEKLAQSPGAGGRGGPSLVGRLRPVASPRSGGKGTVVLDRARPVG